MSAEQPVQPGHVWDLQTVAKIRGLRVQQTISDLARTSGLLDVEEHLRHEVAAQFIDAARVHAVEVDADDLSYDGQYSTIVKGLTIVAWWNPMPRALVVTERGPHRVRVAHSAIEGRVLDVFVVSPTRESLLESILNSDRTRFDLTGWHETERRWLFRGCHE